MLSRSHRLDVAGLRNYLKAMVKQFVEKPGRVRVTSDESERTILYHLSVDGDDLPIMEEARGTLFRSLRHIMRKVTKANVDKNGALDNEFSITP
jgi:predicted RNA-binding protein YlqC (UPF0109 family)